MNDFTGGKNIKQIRGPITYVVLNDVDFIEVDTSTGGAVVIVLQKINAGNTRKSFFISDVSNNASVGGIKIITSGGNLINNQPFIDLKVDGVIAEVEIADRNRFIAHLSTDDTTVTTNGHTIQGNGVSLPQRQNLNFKGVPVTDDLPNNATVVDLIGLLDFQGGYNANTNVPDLVSGAGVLKGYYYVVTNAGTFFGYQLEVGDSLFASVDTPTTLAGWVIVQGNIPLATETAPGIIQIATQLEANAGINDSKAITPLKLKNYISSNVQSQTPIWATSKQYLLIEDFDKGVTPLGWSTSVNGAGSSVTFTQAYESGVIGQAFINNTQAAINNRAGIRFANNFNYLLNFLDCVSTRWDFQFRIQVPANEIYQVGLGNTITPANVLAAAPLTGFGNTIAIRYDPQNRTGENPALISNFYVFVKKAGVGFSTFDTGIAPSGSWESFTFIYDQPTPGVPQIRVYRNDVLVVTINTFTNVPTIIAPAAGADLAPMAFSGTGGFTGGPAGQLRLGKFSIFRIWI